MTRRRSEAGQFFDRTSESGIIDEHVAALGTGPLRVVVLEITGLGGVGKSRFLEQTRDRLAARPDSPTLVWVSLDDEASMSATAPLLAIRNQLKSDCYLFDTALLTYWVATNQRLRPIGNENHPSLAVQTYRAVGEFGHDFLPLDFGARVFAEISGDIALRRSYDANEFSQIDSLREHPSNLFPRLPEYLGLDIARRFRNPDERRLVLFYDGYEKQSANTLAARAMWLQVLIANMHAGVHLIAVRDRLGWNDPELSGFVEHIALGELPDQECRRMIRRALGNLERDVEDRLVDGSRSLPFYLRALIDVCRAEIHRHGAVRVEDLPTSPPAVVEHFLDHLGRSQQTLAVMLAGLQYFDEQLFGHLVHVAGPQEEAVGMSEFVEWFFVENAGGGLYKTHDLLTAAVRSSVQDDPRAIGVLRSAAVHLDVRTKEPPPVGAERLPQLFHALVEAWQAAELVPETDVVQLIDIGYNLYDSGYWQGLMQLPGLATGGRENAAHLTARYFAALATRRTAGPVRALEKLAPLAPLRGQFGRHAASFDVEVAYSQEISGDYAHAREEFRRLSDNAEPFDPGRRDHVRARLYHADMLIMDGQFAEANERLAETYELLDADTALDPVELMRHRGHAYRFSLEFRAAADRYAAALEAAEDSPSMRSKLRTNLAEARCWHDPRRALKNAEAAIDENGRLGSSIEVAKAQAAMGVALARLSRFAEARIACATALEVSEAVDYPAAGCFSRQALVALEVWAGNPARADAAYEDLMTRIRSLGTYTHLAVIPAWIRGDEAEFRRAAEGVGWISRTSLAEGLGLIGRV